MQLLATRRRSIPRENREVPPPPRPSVETPARLVPYPAPADAGEPGVLGSLRALADQLPSAAESAKRLSIETPPPRRRESRVHARVREIFD